MNWKLLSSKYIFRSRWFTVREDKCETPAGVIVDPYYVYEFPTWVGAVPVTADGRIILIKQYRHPVGEVCLEIPGGCVDETDNGLEAAIRRELLEETGYTFTTCEYLGKISPNTSTNTNFLHMYLALGGERSSGQHLDESEEIDIIYVTVAELKQLVKERQFLQSMHVTTILYALEKMGELKL